ncbi:MAG: porphobilinogen synthase [Betaproteobacteria bacterium]|nr:porphobilinogen synthase [Betaproteobacteria bacterium]
MAKRETNKMRLRRRPRRMRSRTFVRDLVAQSNLASRDLIWPLFIHAESTPAAISSMPQVQRLDEKSLLARCERASRLGLSAVALFPCLADDLRSADGREAWNDDGLVQRRIGAIKREFPDLGVMADVALDPYTEHGHDGLLAEDGSVLNDETVACLARQALSLAGAGADIVAPSDMMDARIGVIRESLEHAGFSDTLIVSYAVKYASAFYGPFRDALGSAAKLKGDKRTYQMDFRNRREARLEAELDVEEGADMLLVKPGMPCLDIVRDLAELSPVPVLAYQVSGEYAMLAAASEAGWIERTPAVLESLIAFKRAGASGIVSYWAAEAAEALGELTGA